MDSEHQLLTSQMISGVTSDPPWQEFVCSLRKYFGGNHANVIFRRADLKQTWITRDYDPHIFSLGQPEQLYDPRIDPISYYRLPSMEAFNIQALLPADQGTEHPFYKQFLQSLAMNDMLIVRVATPGGLQAWLSVTHAIPNHYDKQAERALEQVASLFQHALELFGTYQSAVDQRDAYARVVHARATGLICIDQNGLVQSVDVDAARWIGPDKELWVNNARLRVADRAARHRFEEALNNILQCNRDEELLAIEGGNGTTMELLIFRVSDEFEPAWMSSTRALVYIRMAGQELTPTPQRVRTLFGLSRREAALAILLTRGLTLAEAASDLGISDHTVRAYLRQIFQKTGVTRQADLIRQLQASIASVQ